MQTVLFLLGLIVGLVLGVVILLIHDKQHYQCNGSIVLYGNEAYLCLTREDIKAFENKCYATLRLEREKFHGFSET